MAKILITGMTARDVITIADTIYMDTRGLMLSYEPIRLQADGNYSMCMTALTYGIKPSENPI